MTTTPKSTFFIHRYSLPPFTSCTTISGSYCVNSFLRQSTYFYSLIVSGMQCLEFWDSLVVQDEHWYFIHNLRRSGGKIRYGDSNYKTGESGKSIEGYTSANSIKFISFEVFVYSFTTHLFIEKNRVDIVYGKYIYFSTGFRCLVLSTEMVGLLRI